MDRSRVLLIILISVGLLGGAHEFYDRYQETQRRRALAAEAAKKAAEMAEKKAKVEAEKKAQAEKVAAEKAAAEAKTAALRPPPGSLPKESDVPVATEVTIGTPRVGVSGGPPKVQAPPPRPLMEPPPPADKPVPLIPAAEKWIQEGRLTSTLMGNPRLAVINKREYQVGQRVGLPGGLGMTLQQIEDGFVVFEGEGYHFKMRLRTVKD